MLKPTLLNVLLYWFVKYIAFYVLMMFKNNDFTLISLGNIKTSGDLFYYLWMFLFLPGISILLFSLPIYFSFKVSNTVYFLLIIAAVLIVEYFIYTYLASQADLMNGVYNGLLSIIFLLLFFYKPISSLFKNG